MAEYISVKNFDRFQHYKDRKPTWIKLYNDLLDDYHFGCLPDASKWLAVGLWLLASRHENRVPSDPHWIARMIHATDPIDLAPLVSAGFIRVVQDASNSLADRSGSAIPEREVEGEVERETDHLSSKVVRLRGSVDEDAAADQIIMAANKGMNENAAIKDGQPIYTGHGSRQSVMDWLGDGIEWEVARNTCYRVARAYKPNGRYPRITSMGYFDGAVREAWDKVRANQTEVSDGADDRATGAAARNAQPDKYADVTEDGSSADPDPPMRLRAG